MVHAATVDPLFPASPFEAYPILPPRPNADVPSSLSPTTTDVQPRKPTAQAHTLPKHASDIDMEFVNSWQLDRAKLVVGDEIGHGFFGKVHCGTYREGSKTRDVAIKSHSMMIDEDEEAALKQRRVFMLEAQILTEFRNPHGLSTRCGTERVGCMSITWDACPSRGIHVHHVGSMSIT